MFQSPLQRQRFNEAARLLLRINRQAAAARKFVLSRHDTHEERTAIATLAREALDGRIPFGLPASQCVLVELVDESATLLFVDGDSIGARFVRVGFYGSSTAVACTGTLGNPPPNDEYAVHSECIRNLPRVPEETELWHLTLAGITVSARIPEFVCRHAWVESGGSLTRVPWAGLRLGAEIDVARQWLNYCCPTGYVIRGTAKTPHTSRDARLFRAGDEFLVHTNFDRLHHIYEGAHQWTVRPHGVRRHLRHFWREKGYDYRQIHGTPNQRAAFARSVGVRRRWIQPYWVGPEEVDTAEFIYRFEREIELPEAFYSQQEIEEQIKKEDEEGEQTDAA